MSWFKRKPEPKPEPCPLQGTARCFYCDPSQESWCPMYSPVPDND